MLYCRLIYILSILCVRLTIKVRVGIPESLKVGWYPPKKLGRVTLTNDTIFVVFYMYLVSHALCYTEIITYLQSSPKVLEKPMHVPFPLQCWDVITMLRGYNNMAKGRKRGKQREQNFPKCFRVFVWDCSLPEGEKVVGACKIVYRASII